MRFETVHHLAGPPEAVAVVLADPSFYVGLVLPDLATPEVLDAASGADGSLVRLRYRFTGTLDPIAQRLLGGEQLVWLQEVRLDPEARGGSLAFGAEADPRRLHGSASFSLAAAEAPATGTIRHLDGELVVAVPLIGRAAERRIVPGLLRRLDIEAAALDARLGGA